MLSARQRGLNEHVSSFAASGADFTNLSTWEAQYDVDLVAGTTTEVLECRRGVYAQNLQVVTTIATTDASYHRIVRAAPGHEHKGIPGQGVVFTSAPTGTGCFFLGEAFFKVYDISMTWEANSSGSKFGFYASAASIRFVGCMTYNLTNIFAGGAASAVRLFTTCAAVDCLTINTQNDGLVLNATDARAYNCSTINGARGLVASSAGVLKNCLAHNNTTSDFNGTVEATSTHNASSDLTAPGLRFQRRQRFRFVNPGPGNRDFHLHAFDKGARGKGLPLHQDASLPFEDDLDGEEIKQWSIGADAGARHQSYVYHRAALLGAYSVANASTGTLSPGHTYQHRAWARHRVSHT